jgi:negative regulator of sigma E activity
MSDHNQAGDKVDLHNRQQLSALMDGALPPDEARFLLRRLQHDDELSECWERWQLAGEAMRGHAAAVLLPHGFARRVGEAIAGDLVLASKQGMQPGVRWARWGGSVALAASVAVVALLATRQSPSVPAQAASPMAVATPAPMVETPVPSASSPARVETPQSNVVSEATRVAVADAPRRHVQRARSVHRARAGFRGPAPTSAAGPTEVAVAAPATSAETSRPFDAGTLPSSRPWPRAVLPQFGGSGGALTAGTDASGSPSFYPFEPRLPEDAVEPRTAPAQPR